MMICKADFEELFPHVFAACPQTPAKRSKDASLARWENEGGGLAPGLAPLGAIWLQFAGFTRQPRV